jgi:cysteine-rich repeat protein
MASLLSRQHAKMAGTFLMPVAMVLAADAFGGCTSVDTEVPATANTSASQVTSSMSSTSSTGGSGPTTVTSTSSTGGGGTGGAGGGTPVCKNQNTGEDTCAMAGDAGKTITLTAANNFSDCFAGDTSTAKDEMHSAYCPSAQTTGPDRLYHLVFKGTGSLKLHVKADDAMYPVIMHIRGDATFTGKAAVCDDMTNQDLTCINFFKGQQAISAEINPTAETPDLYVVVDGADGKGGKYTLNVSYTAPKCGDGVVNLSTKEDCDDGNIVSGDGCDKTCKFETISVFDTCPGEPFSITTGQTLTFQSSSAPYQHNYAPKAMGQCGSYAAASMAQDRVYQVKAKADGMVTAKIGYVDMGSGPVSLCDATPLDPGCWQYTLYALDAVNPDTCGATCTCNTGAQLACSDQGIFQPQTISFAVKKDHSYFIVVDGDDSIFPSFGPFNLTVSLQ